MFFVSQDSCRPTSVQYAMCVLNSWHLHMHDVVRSSCVGMHTSVDLRHTLINFLLDVFLLDSYNWQQ